MFRKYYKDANNDIKADEVFLNSVIENAHKKRVPSRKNYYRYALTAAAAVVVISATTISFPLLTDHSDDGVISVVMQTVQPDKPTVTNTPTHHPPISTAVPHPPAKAEKKPVKKAEAKTELKEEEKKEKEMEKTAETRSKKTEDLADAGAVKPEISDTADKKVLFSAPVFGVTADTETADTETADEYRESFIYASGAVTEDVVQSECTPSPKKPVGGGGSLTVGNSPSYNNADSDDDAAVMSGGAASYAPAQAIFAPSGYYLSESSGNKYTFLSDSGGKITVEMQYTGSADTAPVYGENSVSFTSNGTEFTVTYQNAEQSAIDEIVNSLR